MNWLIIFALLLLTSCQNQILISNKNQPNLLQMNEKNVNVNSFFNDFSIKPLGEVSSSFHRFIEWYDEKNVLYLTSKGGFSHVYKYSLFSGKKEAIFRSKHPIINVKSNEKQSLFVIHTSGGNYQSTVSIIDRDYQSVFEWNGATKELYLQWNPYNENELLIISILPDWDYKIDLVDAHLKQSTELKVDNPFIHWYSKDKLAYLNWAQAKNDFDAPIFLYNVVSDKNEKLQDNPVVSFLTFKNTLMTISTSKEKENAALYTFYKTKSNEKMNAFFIPIVETFSEFWWTPPHDYIDSTKEFYYLKPVVSNSDGEKRITELTFSKFSLENGEHSSFFEVEKGAALNCSPEGTWCLFGTNLEQLVRLGDNKVFRLINK